MSFCDLASRLHRATSPEQVLSIAGEIQSIISELSVALDLDQINASGQTWRQHLVDELQSLDELQAERITAMIEDLKASSATSTQMLTAVVVPRIRSQQ